MPLMYEDNGSSVLIIAITGYGNKLNLPVEEFFTDSGLAGFSRVTISDDSRLKTLAGLPPEFPTFENLVVFLKGLINKYKRVIITGTSGGAHTALLLGHLLKADYVVAFAVYPYLSVNELKRLHDPALISMSKLVKKFDGLPPESKKYFDLPNVLKDWNGRTTYFVHVSRFNKFDYRRALCLSGAPKVHVIAHPFKEHAIAGALSRSGMLRNCFSFPYQAHNASLYKLTYMHISFYVLEVLRWTRDLTRRFSQSA